LTSPFATAYHEGKDGVRLAREWTSIRSLRKNARNPREVALIDHHSCHAASAFFLSPFEKALILTLDGEGDGSGGIIARGEGNRIDLQKRIPFSDSLGRVYSCITALLGFSPSREEHKTQWLSLEGEPIYRDLFVRMLRAPGRA